MLEINNCKLCRLHKTRNKVVVGSGNETADVMIIGEAPGASEDAQGLPFVGPSGDMLNQYIDAIGIKRDDVYITNVCKCRPPSNRNPEPDEIKACTPYLVEQIEKIKPRVVITLGRFASQYIIPGNQSIGNSRGKIHMVSLNPLRDTRTSVIATWHPAYVLRNRDAGYDVHEDMQLVKERLRENG